MKHTKKFLAALLAITLTACGNSGTAEVTDQTAKGTSSVSETVSDELAAETEETTTETTEEEPIEDNGVFSPSKLNYIFSLEENADYVEITENTKFYECCYSRNNLVTDENSFKNSAAVQKAKELLKNSDKVSADIEAAKEEFLTRLDISGDIDFKFTQAITADFDRNGKEESFMVFDTYMGENNISEASMFNLLSYVIFADSSGNVQIIGEPSAEIEIYELQYSGFSHFVVSGGVNISTSVAHYYSVNGNEVKHELEQFSIGSITDGFALEHTAAQSPRSWMFFWNEEAGEYVTPCSESLSDEDEELIFNMLPLDGMDDEEIADMREMFGISVIGRKFFNIIYPKTFIYENGKFIEREAEESWFPPLGGYFDQDIPIAVNFDYDKALKNLIPLTETSPAANKSDEYKDLYKAFLTDLTNTYGDYDLAEGEEVYGDPDIVCFDLCDIDNDGVPELFVSEDGYRQTTADIYTVADGEVVKLGSKGDFGRIFITEKYIAETYVGMGCINVDIFAKNGNSLESVVSIKDYRQGFNLDAADRCCMLNDEIVSEEAMQKEIDKYTSMQWYSVGRNYALCTKAINDFFESDVEKAAQITGKYSTKLVETD